MLPRFALLASVSLLIATAAVLLVCRTHFNKPTERLRSYRSDTAAGVVTFTAPSAWGEPRTEDGGQGQDDTLYFSTIRFARLPLDKICPGEIHLSFLPLKHPSNNHESWLRTSVDVVREIANGKRTIDREHETGPAWLLNVRSVYRQPSAVRLLQSATGAQGFRYLANVGNGIGTDTVYEALLIDDVNNIGMELTAQLDCGALETVQAAIDQGIALDGKTAGTSFVDALRTAYDASVNAGRLHDVAVMLDSLVEGIELLPR